MELSFAERQLGWLLGLGDLQSKPICMGYANCCVCDLCMDRESQPKRKRVRQPWEPL